MRRAFSVLLAALLCAALLAGCGNKAPVDSFSIHPDADGGEPESVTRVQSGSAADGASGSEADGGGDTGSQAGAGSEPEVLNSVTGVIDGAGMGDFYVMLDDGMVLAFPHEEADVSGLEDSMPGSPITVWFTGELDGNDTSGVTVVRMETPNQ